MKSPVHIALVSDTHLSCDADGTAPLYRQRLDRAISAVNASGVDLVLFAGDLTERATPEDVKMALDRMRQFTAPVFFVAGNHDVGDKLSLGGANPITEARLDAYEARIGPAFFAEHFNGLRLIGVTASLFNSGLPREEEQWAFLDAQLQAPTSAMTLLLTHYPPFVETPEEPADYWNMDPSSRRRLLTLLGQGTVGAVLSGHTHHPRIRRHKRIEYVTSPAIAFSLPIHQQPEGWMLLTVSKAGEVHAALYEV